MTESLPQNSVIISAQWDYFCSAFIYKQLIEKYRTDVVLVEQELLRRTWYLEQFKLWYPELAEKCSSQISAYLADLELFESNKSFDAQRLQAKYEDVLNAFIDKTIADGRNVYITSDVFEREPNVAKSYDKVPNGLSFRLEKQRVPREINVSDFNPDKLSATINKFSGRLYDGARLMTANAFVNMGFYAMRSIQAPGVDSVFITKQIVSAGSAFRSALKIDPKNASALKSLQVIDNLAKSK
jgi:hypothetical protein